MATRPTTLQQEFLHDIIEHPDDDAPRLVYADWLDDHGDHDRAEFIRTQIELDRLDLDDPRRGEMVARESVLLGLHEDRWRAPLPGLLNIEWGRFRRGFVAEVIVDTVAVFRRRTRSIFSAAPVQELRLRYTHRVTDLASLPALARMTSLALHQVWLFKSQARVLAASPNLAGLTGLALNCCAVEGGALKALLTAPLLRGLVSVQLTNCTITARDLRLVAGLPELRRIRELDLSGCRFWDAGGEALLASANLTGLRRLRLQNLHLSPEMRKRLLQRFPFALID